MDRRLCYTVACTVFPPVFSHTPNTGTPLSGVWGSTEPESWLCSPPWRSYLPSSIFLPLSAFVYGRANRFGSAAKPPRTAVRRGLREPGLFLALRGGLPAPLGRRSEY